jgi:hypothetical protein
LDGRFDRPNRGLGYFDILFDRARTGSDRTNHDTLTANWKSAPKYDNLTLVAAVDAVERFFWLSQLGENSRRNLEYASGECFLDGEINTADQGAVLTRESQQVTLPASTAAML